MPLLTDEPLIDDSELDEFDWDAYLVSSNESQPVTFRGYTVKLFHEVMQATCLVASAVLFKSASWVLGHAVWHTDKINRKRRRMFGVHRPTIEPCSDFDPIHPDYTPYSEK